MAEYYKVSQQKILYFTKEIGYVNHRNFNSWKPNDSKEEFIKRYDEYKSATKMGEYYNVCKRTILKYAKKIGYVNHYRPELSQEQIDYICENYNFKTSLTLGEELPVSSSYVKATWRKHGLKGKHPMIYYTNFDYFEKIDSYDKAYFVGLLGADGCVYKRPNEENRQALMSLNLHQRDKEILFKMKQYMQSENNITYHNEINLSGSISPMATLVIVSDKMVKDLSQYNIVYRKTWEYVPTNIPKQFMWHFIRGFFDGDGSIYVSRNYTYIRFCGNDKVMNYLQTIFNQYDITSTLTEDKRKYNGKFYNMEIVSKASKIKFLQLLYQDDHDLCLDRKKKIAMNYLHKTNSFNVKIMT